MATLYLVPISLVPQWFTNVGVMAALGTVMTYLAGTTTPVTTYTDNTGLVANPNPLTLSSAGKPVSASGAPVAFWVPSGITVKIVVYDASGNQLQYLDQLAALDDPSATGSVLTQLASAASSNASGIGPVAGADLVANAVKSYDIFADVRAANQPVLASGQTLSISVQGSSAVNDGQGGDFYWSPTSSATDNGTTVLKPNATTGNGRWLRLYTPPFGFEQAITGAVTTDLGTLGTNNVLITGSGINITSFGTSASASRPLYFVEFNGANTIAPGANLIGTPGNQTLTTAQGDWALLSFTSAAAGWQVLAYFPAVYNVTRLVQAADQAVASSTTLVPATNLQANLPPGTFLVQARLLMLGTAGTGQGYKVQLNYTGTFNTPAAGIGTYSQNLTPGAGMAQVNALLTASAISDTNPDVVSLDYILDVATAGALALEFTQNSSSANATTLKAGSHMLITRVA